MNQIDSKGDRTGIFAFNPPGTKPIKGKAPMKVFSVAVEGLKDS